MATTTKAGKLAGGKRPTKASSKASAKTSVKASAKAKGSKTKAAKKPAKGKASSDAKSTTQPDSKPATPPDQPKPDDPDADVPQWAKMARDARINALNSEARQESMRKALQDQITAAQAAGKPLTLEQITDAEEKIDALSAPKDPKNPFSDIKDDMKLQLPDKKKKRPHKWRNRFLMLGFVLLVAVVLLMVGKGITGKGDRGGESDQIEVGDNQFKTMTKKATIVGIVFGLVGFSLAVLSFFFKFRGKYHTPQGHKAREIEEERREALDRQKRLDAGEEMGRRNEGIPKAAP